MTGQDSDGLAVTYHRREARRLVPPGRLSQQHIIDTQTTIARGLANLGYTDAQIAQILGLALRTVGRRARGARRHASSPPPSRLAY